MMPLLNHIKKPTKIFFVILGLLLAFPTLLPAQKFEFNKRKPRYSTSFKKVGNLVIVKLRINKSKPMNFILDSGSGYLILTNLQSIEELKLNQGRQVFLRGLGQGYKIESYLSENNLVEIGKIRNKKTDVILLFNSGLQLSSKLGVTIHGIIGYELFRDFLIDINYMTNRIKFYDSDFFHQTKSKQLEGYTQVPLNIKRKKSYLAVNGQYKNGKQKKLNLLVDTGSWESFWLFKNDSLGISLPKKHIDDFLGFGLGGKIYGKRSRLERIEFAGNTFELPTASFPDSLSIGLADQNYRNGTIGSEVLRRYRVIFDYKNKQLYVKPNKHIKQKFHYNMAGLELKKLYNLPVYEVIYVRKHSPAYWVGIKKGDIVQEFNLEPADKTSLNEINRIFHQKEGKRIHLKVSRGRLPPKIVSFVLEAVI